MKNHSISIKERLNNILLIIGCYFVSAGAIITSNGEWWYDENITISSSEAVTMFSKWALVLVIVFLIIRMIIYYSMDSIYKIIAVGFCLFLFTLMNPEEYNDTWFQPLYLFLLPGMVLFFLMLKDKTMFWKSFINVVVVIAVISLFFYIFGSLLKLVKPLELTDHTWGSWGNNTKNYYYVYYEAQRLTISKEKSLYLVRNTGFFTEAPMFNFELCLALGAEWFLVKEKRAAKIWKSVVLVITILTTITTTGQIYIVGVVFGILLLHIYKKWNTGSLSKKNKMSIIIVLCAIAGLGVVMVLLKFLTGSGASSSSVRYDHIMGSFRAWLDQKVFGWGFLNNKAIYTYLERKQGMSIGFPYMLACGGLTLGSVFIIPYVHNLIISLRRRKLNEAVFDTLFFLLHFLTIIFARPIFIVTIAYMISFDGIKRKGRTDEQQANLYPNMVRNR